MTAPRPQTGPPARYSETRPRAPQSADYARRMVHQAMNGWGLTREDTQTAALLLSELVSNAVRHAHKPCIRIIVDRPTTHLVYLAVIDRSPATRPQLCCPVPEDTTGRGLVLVDGYARQWGCDLMGPPERPWGKRVWAVINVEVRG